LVFFLFKYLISPPFLDSPKKMTKNAKGILFS